MARRGHAALLQLRNQTNTKHSQLTRRFYYYGRAATSCSSLRTAGTARLTRQGVHTVQVGRTYHYPQNHLLLQV